MMNCARVENRGIGVRPACWALVVLIVALATRPSAGQPTDGGSDPAERLRRIVHQFDFDERELGNFEPVPMFWQRVDDVGFPEFAGGLFDKAVGHDAPPSFRLDSDGRNVAFWYSGPGTEVRPNSEYLVEGWIRPRGLVHARTSLSAYYVDRNGLPIAGTQAFSALVGGSGENEPWRRVEVHLGPAPGDARTMGLTAWVIQAAVWDPRTRPHRHIEAADLEAGAWLDDITVYRVPSATLKVANPAGLFVEPEVPEIKAQVADSDSKGLTATLTVTGADGRQWHESQVPVQVERVTTPTLVRLPQLPPGLYVARLTILAAGREALSRHLRFAYLAAPYTRSVGVAAPFGLALDPHNRTAPEAESHLLAALSVGAVKIPVWGPAASQAGGGTDSDPQDLLLHDLVKARVALTGVLSEPPPGLTESAGEYARGLLEILSDDPAGWRPYLAAVVAPNASVFRTWQIGADHDTAAAVSPALPEALRRVRKEMTDLLTTVYLAAPADAAIAPGQMMLPTEEITVQLAPDIRSDWIPAYLAEYQRLDYERVSAFVAVDRQSSYARLPHLARFAKRLIRARHADAATVYVPQLWQTRPTPAAPVTEPSEEFIVCRTIVDLLRDLTPGPTLQLGKGITTLAFFDANEAILAMWDEGAPSEGRIHELELGSATQQIDLWGNVSELEVLAQDRRRVRLSPVPVFIGGIERWLIEFASAVRISPQRSELSLLPRTHLLHFANVGGRAVAGKVSLEAPAAWELRPSSFAFRIPGQSEHSQPVEFQFPHNEPAGVKVIRLAIDLETDPPHHLDIPVTLELGIPDVDVWGFAFLEGDRLVLRHGVTNRSSQALDLRSSAAAPGRSRQFRIIPALGPGQTTTAEYRFERADELTGRMVRLRLREVDGPRQHVIELKTP